MKTFVIFMAILLFLAGFDLCKEEVTVESKARIALSESGKASQERHEMCSPFCQCAGCQFSILLPASINVPKAMLLTKLKFQATFSETPIGISVIVWQPPKQV